MNTQSLRTSRLIDIFVSWKMDVRPVRCVLLGSLPDIPGHMLQNWIRAFGYDSRYSTYVAVYL